MAVTFSDHPMAHIAPDAVPPRLADNETRIRRLGREVDKVVVEDFADIRHLTAAGFMQRLADRYSVSLLLLGYDTRFGSDMPRSHSVYAAAAAAAGITVIFCDDAEHTGTGAVIASSGIRKALTEGNVSAAADMLGRPYALTGTVIAGRRQGRTIGFPTANIAVADARVAMPRAGVYACRAAAVAGDGTRLFSPRPAMVNIGTCPTFTPGSCRQTIEAHIPGFSGDLYGATLTLEFIRRLRDEQRFPSVEALRRQLEKDAEETLKG